MAAVRDGAPHQPEMSDTTTSPYEGLPARAFWRTGVAEADPAALPDLVRPKFPIASTDRIATAGSCFAQHIGQALRKRGYGVLDVEPAPRELTPADAIACGYGIYSARYGNVYTPRQLLQLIRESRGEWQPAEAVWERDGRFYDALRPGVEPAGLASPEECRALRADHLTAVTKLLDQTEVLVFTLGLTETWEHRDSGTIYPTAPGTIAGRHDQDLFSWRNFTYEEVTSDLREIRRLLQIAAPRARMLLTVSPVPLTATASGEHALVATTYSKAVLRAAAGAFSAAHADVDYFPSFEIVSGIQSRSAYFESNLRSVTAEGVATVMRAFLVAHEGQPIAPRPAAPLPLSALLDPWQAIPSAVAATSSMPAKTRAPEAAADDGDADDVVCEEALLDAFSRS